MNRDIIINFKLNSDELKILEIAMRKIEEENQSRFIRQAIAERCYKLMNPEEKGE